jgi:hypothetical protein
MVLCVPLRGGLQIRLFGNAGNMIFALYDLICPSVRSKIEGLPSPSVTTCNFEFRPPFVRPIKTA